MRSFILLLKIQMFGMFGINKALHADVAKARRSIALALLAVVGIVLIAVWYSATVASAMVTFGMVDLIPFTAVLIGSLAGAVASFLKANGVLFSFRDYDMVMSLPVSVTSVVLSRVASLYAMSFVFGLLVMVPPFVVYAMNAGVSGVGMACMVAVLVLAPLLPLSVAIVLAALIMAVSARFRRASIIASLLSVALVVAIVFGSCALTNQMDGAGSFAAVASMQTMALEGAYPPAQWAAAAVRWGDISSFMLFAGVSLALPLGFLAALVRVFVPVNAFLRDARPRGVFSFDKASAPVGGGSLDPARSPFRALVAKEARLLIATPVYLVNACTGYVLVLVVAVAAAVGRVMGFSPLDSLPPDYVPMVLGLLPWLLAFCMGIASTTTASVSLEGSNRWLMLTAPVSPRMILKAKAMLNLCLAVPTVLASGVLLSVAVPVDVITVVALFVVPMAFALFATFFGLALDAWHPRYDWTTVYEPVKRSVAVFVVALGGMVLVAVGIAATLFGGSVAMLGVALVIGAASVVLFRQTVRQGLSD